MILVGFLLMFLGPVVFGLGLLIAYYFITKNYIQHVVRIFQEKPLFIIPRGDANVECEQVRFPTSGGLILQGSYFKTSLPRKGVIIFGLEFGSNRFGCLSYSEWLVNSGYDVFSFEPRNQGDSDKHLGYEPLQWITQYEVDDMKSALAYLKTRPDADPRGVGFFGISKGAASGLFVGAEDPYVLCSVSDGVFGTFTTMVPFMKQWISIYSKRGWLHAIIPDWFFGLLASDAIKRSEKERSGNARFVHLEPKIKKLVHPWLMVQGALDSYIRPEMARTLFKLATGPKKLWVVPGARHNMSIQTLPEEYKNRVTAFFDATFSPDSALLKHSSSPTAWAPLAETAPSSK